MTLYSEVSWEPLIVARAPWPESRIGLSEKLRVWVYRQKAIVLSVEFLVRYTIHEIRTCWWEIAGLEIACSDSETQTFRTRERIRLKICLVPNFCQGNLLMNTTEYEKYDCKKLHSEITQIVSQRFQLTTLALVLFAGVCGWLTQAVVVKQEVNATLVGSVSVLLIIVLSLLFFYSTLLTGILRVYSVYLDLKFKSSWERDWKKYRAHARSRRYWGYSKASAAVFFVVGLLSFGYPLILFWFVTLNQTHRFQMTPILWIALVLLVLYLSAVVYITARRYRYFDEELFWLNWKEVISSNSNPTDQHSISESKNETSGSHQIWQEIGK